MHPNDNVSDGQPEPPVDAADAAGAEASPEAAVEPAASVRRRPRGRTALIIAAAAVLGIAGGIATGYGVQADRAPTPLAALSQPDLAYPAEALPAGRAPDPLPASQDRRVRTDGDLRKLIVPRPKGWSDNKYALFGHDGWMRLEEYALDFDSADYMFGDLLESDIRRIASASWTKGEHREVNVWLVQFRSGVETGAVDHARGQLFYMPKAAGNPGDPLKGSGNGRYYLYEPDRKPGYLPIHRARAVFQRGDVMAEINIFDTSPISKKDIRTLAEKQLERL